uniref:TATA-box binding protein n=1 Tax=Nucleocytoviricota sp. TaxID=2809609 RepID=A0A9E8GAJ1_9VIRU|nr:TATA-box binding protein [Nucleocytoviricota sp.]UZT29087.1 hypothetical protein [Nucleocytoviricota sp.]
MKNKNLNKDLNYFGEFIYKIYNYFIVSFNDFNNILLKNYDFINDDFIYCILIRGIQIIEKIFIYNIYICNYEIQSLQNISKKIIDLYFKFIDQLIAMNNNINLSIKDAEIFIYKKIIDKSINNFKELNDFEKKLINIIKINNSYLSKRISNYLLDNNIKNIDVNLVLNYSKEINQIIKTI